MGSKREKRRGLSVKHTSKLLDYMGVRVYSSETQGVFCKTADADRYLLCLTSGGFDSGPWILIMWPGTKGRAGGGGIPPEQSSAAAGSPEKANPAFPGSV